MEFFIGADKRTVRTLCLDVEVAVIGGGLAGVCAAISAARKGAKVCLVNDRPVLGGNASSEIRVWALGATAHMGNNNRFSREGGIIDEILTENMYRNREGNPILFDMLLIDKVLAEKNIELILNTSVFEVELAEGESPNHIKSVTGFCASSETRYVINAEIFIDSTGDGIVSHLAGASYSMGAEDRDAYDEKFAPDPQKYGEVMGDTIFFYMKDTGKPVKYIAPDFALKDVDKQISKLSNVDYFNTRHHGCKYWWLEWGGRLDTVHDTEIIKRELWKVVYGIWDYIKNSGRFPEMETYTLEWAGMIPGKRESRRIKGLYTLTQNDIVGQREFVDAVSYGGWAIDLHPADGVYADGAACNQWHSKGVYQIPYRCFIGDDVDNLFFAGRIISATHVANGSTRVMCTSAHGGAVVGTAAALCVRNSLMPADYCAEDRIVELRLALEESGHFVPGCMDEDKTNLLHSATLVPSSILAFSGFAPTSFKKLEYPIGLMFPVRGRIPAFAVSVSSDEPAEVKLELRKSGKIQNYTPDQTLDSKVFNVKAGEQKLRVEFDSVIENEQYVMVSISSDKKISVGVSDRVLTSVVTVLNQQNRAVSNLGKQVSDGTDGFESFEFWCPERRPQAANLALEFENSMNVFSVEKMKNACKRPYISSNAWVADPLDSAPAMQLRWDTVRTIQEITLFFDADFDHAMEPIQFQHPENVVPQCVRSVIVSDADGNILYSTGDNHSAVCRIVLDEPVMTDALNVSLRHTEYAPASMFHITVR